VWIDLNSVKIGYLKVVKIDTIVKNYESNQAFFRWRLNMLEENVFNIADAWFRFWQVYQIIYQVIKW